MLGTALGLDVLAFRRLPMPQPLSTINSPISDTGSAFLSLRTWHPISHLQLLAVGTPGFGETGHPEERISLSREHLP